MDKRAFFWYNSEMRFVAFLLVGAFVTIGLLSQKTGAANPSLAFAKIQDAAAARADVDNLLVTIDLASHTGDATICETLSPIPLYDRAPDAMQWRTFCLAQVDRNAARCNAIPGMLIPDLQTFCHDTF